MEQLSLSMVTIDFPVPLSQLSAVAPFPSRVLPISGSHHLLIFISKFIESTLADSLAAFRGVAW
jgi:hypothetical protein